MAMVTGSGPEKSTWGRQEYFEGAFGEDITVTVTSYYAGGSYELDQSGVVLSDLTILISACTTQWRYDHPEILCLRWSAGGDD